MLFIRHFVLALAGLIAAAGVLAAETNPVVSTPPVYLPDYSLANQPLPEGVIAWDALIKTVDLTNDQQVAKLTFDFTNITAGVVTILSVNPSCGCTTAELPPVPWVLAVGTNGQIGINVDAKGKGLEDKLSTLFKTVAVVTDKGRKDLILRINILPPPPMPKMTEAQRAAGIAAAKVDRQAVFKGSCASCHLPKIEGKYGQQLFKALCSICHEAEHRASIVPDLHNLPVPTNEEFWRTWITYGKPGSLMPAFAKAQGGPMSDLQIASLAAYLNAVIPSRATNAPTVK
jgi:mono/diheme cytochrome c family protein